MATQSSISPTLCTTSTSQSGNMEPSKNLLEGPAASGMPHLSEILSLLSGLMSFSPLPDWLNIFVFSGFIATFRTYIYRAWDAILSALWISVVVEYHDDAYDWICLWLSKSTQWQNARDFDISTSTVAHPCLPDIRLDDSKAIDVGSPQVRYTPQWNKTYSLWYQNRYVTVRRLLQDRYGTDEDRLDIRVFSFDRSVLVRLFEEAKALYEQNRETKIRLFVPFRNNKQWECVGSTSKRRIETIILDPGVKEQLIKDCKDFLQSKAWYSDRGIPFRRGYLLYGVPGSGKTSLIQGIAEELKLDIYIISISRAGLDDQSLGGLFADLPEKCIAIMEDLDAAFSKVVGDRGADVKKDDEGQGEDDTNLPSSRVTLSGLLNALDGVGAQEGRILFATTNHVKALDPALCRPGRMDVQIEFELASKFQAEELFRAFYDSPNNPAEDSEAAATALKGIHGTASDEKGPLTPCGIPEAKQMTLSRQQIIQLATRFADAIPEREFSMAALQGYLMQFKTDPQGAAENTGNWVAERDERKRKGENEDDSFLIRSRIGLLKTQQPSMPSSPNVVYMSLS